MRARVAMRARGAITRSGVGTSQCSWVSEAPELSWDVVRSQPYGLLGTHCSANVHECRLNKVGSALGVGG